MKKAILRRYDISPETYRQKFRATKKKDHEAYTELAARLQDLAKKWLTGCDTASAVLVKVVLEQFLDTVSVELRVWLCERKPTTVAEASSMADDYRAAHRRKRFEGGKIDSNRYIPSKETSDPKQDGPNKETQKGHTQEKRQIGPNQKGERSRDLTERRCFNCHERSHWARECPSALYCGTSDSQGAGGRDAEGSGGGGDSGVGLGEVKRESVGGGGGSHGSVSCGDGSGGDGDVVGSGQAGVLWGHMEVWETVGTGGGRCTTSDRSIDGTPVKRIGKVEGTLVDDVVLDTGCACTMVHRDLIPEEKVVPGATIQLRCAHGDVVTYPLAAVTLEIDGLTLPVTVAVDERLPVSVLLGTDVPELGKLINQCVLPQAEALVMTRAQVKAQTQAEAQAQQKQHQSQVPVMEPLPLSTFDDDLFLTPHVRQLQTRR